MAIEVMLWALAVACVTGAVWLLGAMIHTFIATYDLQYRIEEWLKHRKEK